MEAVKYTNVCTRQSPKAYRIINRVKENEKRNSQLLLSLHGIFLLCTSP